MSILVTEVRAETPVPEHTEGGSDPIRLDESPTSTLHDPNSTFRYSPRRHSRSSLPGRMFRIYPYRGWSRDSPVLTKVWVDSPQSRFNVLLKSQMPTLIPTIRTVDSVLLPVLWRVYRTVYRDLRPGSDLPRHRLRRHPTHIKTHTQDLGLDLSPDRRVLPRGSTTRGGSKVLEDGFRVSSGFP